MAEKKKKKSDGWAGWSKPVIKGKKKGRPTLKAPASQSSSRALAAESERQRRGMAATRKKAVAKRPNRPISPSQLREVRQREQDRMQDQKMLSAAMKRSRERMKFQGR